MVVYDKENSGLQRISEAKIKHPQRLIPFDMTRTSLALFSTEVISRSILEGYQNEELFDFLEESITKLDNAETNLSHFPLVFLLENAKHLGFAPELGEEFLAESIHHPFSMGEIQFVLPYLKDLLEHTYHASRTLPLPLRRKLLDYLVEFHAQHLAHSQPLKSLPIIRQLIS